MKRFVTLGLAVLLLAACSTTGKDDHMMDDTMYKFSLKVMNVSDGSDFPTPLAPGVYAVHGEGAMLFMEGMPDPGYGLEALAEDGNPAMLAESMAMMDMVREAGVFSMPVGSDSPGPLLPGSSYEAHFMAMPGDMLSFATMMVQSNDLFFGTGEMGIPLFDEDCMPMEGDITMMVALWDAGTEVNQEPGAGMDQAPRQSGPDTGAMDDIADTVRNYNDVDDGFSLPEVPMLIKVMLTAEMMEEMER